MNKLRITLAQINLTVGDMSGNAARVRDCLDRARDLTSDIVLFPELTLTGYPPEDLVLKRGFTTASREALDALVPYTGGLTVVVGFAERKGDDVYNAAAVLHDARLVGIQHKTLLPNYAVFDEKRYFTPSDSRLLFRRPLEGTNGGVCFGVSICEDIWYPDGPPRDQAVAGAELLLNISASPYQTGKIAARERMLVERATRNTAIVASCNLVGGQDELVFDGGSSIVDEQGQILARAASFEEDFVTADVDIARVGRERQRAVDRRANDSDRGTATFEMISVPALPDPRGERPNLAEAMRSPLETVEEAYRALVLGTRDYVRKNGFDKVVLGLSGGVDSAIVAAIAVDALGSENVICVWMPSRHSSTESEKDAVDLAGNLGVRLETVSIEPAYVAYREMLSEFLPGAETSVTDENLQSRARGNVLMALSNRYGWLVLTTGNKSELAVGYATIYGDMAGGFAVIKDVPKGWVYRLCRYRNDRLGPDIPETILSKPPSAELRPDQKDSDSLPDYDVLDAILAAYIEDEKRPVEIIALGHDEGTVRRVIGMVDRNEYKRRQAPPGPKITSKAFGKDRRLPITNRYVPGTQK